MLVLGRDDEVNFRSLIRDYECQAAYIEDLVADATAKSFTADRLLTTIGKFRYQALKKLLGVASCGTDLALVLDSETQVDADLVPLFAGDLQGTTVLYTERPWERMASSLTTDVFRECNSLLARTHRWYFESFNWLYSRQLTIDLLESLRSRHGTAWMFRPYPLFECQLYFQYCAEVGAPYRFMDVSEVLADELGEQRAEGILAGFFNSALQANGVFEYLASVLSRAEYEELISRPNVLKHLRLPRHEPSEVYNVVDAVKRRAASSPHYFGVASMHRGEFTSTDIAVLVCGIFRSHEDVFNARNLIAGVRGDVIVAVESNSTMLGLIRDVLKPVAIVEVLDRDGESNALLGAATGFERGIKSRRDIGSMSMFRKLAACFQAMKEYEKSRGSEYGVVIRLRPDLFALGGLHRVIYDLAERGPALAGNIFFPDSFWSQGINDQFFLGGRGEMQALLNRLSPDEYANSDYLNPEYFVANSLLATGLKAVPFPFEYLLTRGVYPRSVSDIQPLIDEQARHFWSRHVSLPLYKNVNDALHRRILNSKIKNAFLTTRPAWLRGRHLEYLIISQIGGSGEHFGLLSDAKSPEIVGFQIPRWLVGVFSYGIVSGIYHPKFGQPVQLLAYDAETRVLKVEVGTSIFEAVAVLEHSSFARRAIRSTVSLARRLSSQLARAAQSAVKFTTRQR